MNFLQISAKLCAKLRAKLSANKHCCTCSRPLESEYILIKQKVRGKLDKRYMCRECAVIYHLWKKERKEADGRSTEPILWER